MLKPVVGHNAEIGTKSSFLDERLNLSFALFQITQTNRAMTVAGQRYSVPEGKVRSRGFEVELSGEVTPDWNVFAGYTFNRSKYMRTESTTYSMAPISASTRRSTCCVPTPATSCRVS